MASGPSNRSKLLTRTGREREERRQGALPNPLVGPRDSPDGTRLEEAQGVHFGEIVDLDVMDVTDPETSVVPESPLFPDLGPKVLETKVEKENAGSVERKVT